MKKGSIVKMKPSLKEALIKNGCKEHVDEFGDFIGIVEGLVDYGNSLGPEVNVRWKPSGLRYAYHPKELEEIK